MKNAKNEYHLSGLHSRIGMGSYIIENLMKVTFELALHINFVSHVVKSSSHYQNQF